MADTESAPAAPAPVKEKKAAKPKKAATHPPYHQMISEAISSLKEKGGSSRQAILKYIVKNHKVKADNVSGAQLKLALKRGVASGLLKQSKGTGASGSFKLGDQKKTEKKKPQAKKPATKKAAKVKKPKSPAKKVAKPKKSPAKKAKKPKVAKPVKKAKSPKKVKKPAPKKATKAKPKAAKKAKK